jgi:spore coat protein CotH
MKGYILVKVNDKNKANFLLLALPCKSYNVKTSVFDEKLHYIIANDVELEKIDLNQLIRDSNVIEILCRRTEDESKV